MLLLLRLNSEAQPFTEGAVTRRACFGLGPGAAAVTRAVTVGLTHWQNVTIPLKYSNVTVKLDSESQVTRTPCQHNRTRISNDIMTMIMIAAPAAAAVGGSRFPFAEPSHWH